MGAAAPYENEDDSSLNESEDEQIVAVMDADRFLIQVNELIRSIVSGEYTMDAALFNIQQIKHGYSKTNDEIIGAILPAILNEISNQMNIEMNNQQKLAILTSKLPQFKEMISSFMMGLEDEANVVYLVALSCSQKLELLGSCFYLIL